MRAFLLTAFLVLSGCGEKAVVKTKEAPRLPRITHFYGNAATVAKGESLTLCYGTDNVETLTMQPSDEGKLEPSFNRCVAHTPSKDTTYVLTAKGPGGETTASFSVRVGKAKPKDRVLIQSFLLLGNTPVAPGTPVQLCYSTEGASTVSLRPPVPAKLEVGLNRCIVVRPAKTTNYVLSATAEDGVVDQMQVTVAVQ